MSTTVYSQGKPVIAVGEITSAVGDFNTMSIQLSLENALQKTNKYTMMERTRLNSLLQERGLSMSGVTDGRSDLSGFSGVDYLVYGSVSNVAIERKNALIAFSCDASLSMNIRVVDVNTGEIRLSESVNVEAVLNTTFDESDPCYGVSLANINIMGEETADDIANKLTTAIFPIKVARVSKGQVYLNYGQGSLQEGQPLTIKEIGEGFLDPDTGEVLGAEETTTAVIVVTDVRKSFSIGDIVVSDSPINVADIAYKIEGRNSAKAVKKCSSDSKKAVKACEKDSSGKKCKQANTRKTKSCSVLLDL
tara:strand:+ start:1277 stop:2194 length:918 start_codon:yes stop_codon:yes gene_type:complete